MVSSFVVGLWETSCWCRLGIQQYIHRRSWFLFARALPAVLDECREIKSKEKKQKQKNSICNERYLVFCIVVVAPTGFVKRFLAGCDSLFSLYTCADPFRIRTEGFYMKGCVRVAIQQKGRRRVCSLSESVRAIMSLYMITAPRQVWILHIHVYTVE